MLEGQVGVKKLGWSWGVQELVIIISIPESVQKYTYNTMVLSYFASWFVCVRLSPSDKFRARL